MTKHQFLRLLETRVAKSPTRFKAAERLEISPATLSRVLSGKDEPGPKLLRAFGLKRVVLYVADSTLRKQKQVGKTPILDSQTENIS